MEIEFEEFKKNYMSNFDGYIPTYIKADEEFDTPGLIKIGVEMIAPFRMTDGPSRFFKVLHLEVTELQYEEVKKYMANAGDAWKKNLTEGAENVFEYSNKFK